MAVFQYLAAALSWVFLKVFCKLEIYGIENLRELKKPYIAVSNHESHLDPQLLAVALLRQPSLYPIRYMSKDLLFFIPGLNLLIWFLGAFRAHKKKGIEKSLRAPLHILKNGGAVIMFPEGKMIKERPKLGEGRRGAAMLALMTDAAILPMSVHTPHDLPPIVPISIDRPKIIIRIGEPFYLNNVDFPNLSDENTYAATQVIMKKIADLYFQHKY